MYVPEIVFVGDTTSVSVDSEAPLMKIKFLKLENRIILQGKI